MSTDTVSPLRQRMMDDMSARKLGAHSHHDFAGPACGRSGHLPRCVLYQPDCTDRRTTVPGGGARDLSKSSLRIGWWLDEL